MISFSTTKTEAALVKQIAERAARMAIENEIEYEFVTASMDITACHANGCHLWLKELLAAPNADFGHDVFGIRRFLDRETGQLGGCFTPRFAR